MNSPARQDQGKATVHDTSCAQRIRVLRLAAAGDPAEPPARLLHAIAAEIRECCGHPPLRAHRLAWGLTVTTALRALRARPGASPNVSNRSWQDWEAGQRPADATRTCSARCSAPALSNWASAATTGTPQARQPRTPGPPQARQPRKAPDIQ